MLANGGRSHRLGRRGATLGLAILCSAATAAGAAAAGLKVSVPAHVRTGARYTIKITGHYRNSEMTGRAYLISLIQFSSAPCQTSAQLENQKVNSNLLQFYFASQTAPQKVGIFEKSSPFSRPNAFTARRVGSRHVCTYLYPRFIGANDTTAPIATADRGYKVTRK